MKQINIEFEEYDGTLQDLVDNSSDGDRFLIKTENTLQNNRVDVMFLKVNKCMNGNIGIVDGHFSYDYNNFSKLIGVCKVVC